MSIDDPLKPLEEIYQPDPRRPNIVGGLVDEYAELSSIRLHDGVPSIAAQLFETAKNVSLYSWFVYRFHPVAESVAFSALELALNLHKTGLSLLPPDFRSEGLSRLLREAIGNGVIRESEFPSQPAIVTDSARMALIARMMAGNRDGVGTPRPAERDMSPASYEVSLTQHLVILWPQVRNTLAHGSPRLTPNSRQTLRLVAETINQLFPQDGSTVPP
jgi:hypothetical protein